MDTLQRLQGDSSSCDESDEDITASLHGFTLCFTADDGASSAEPRFYQAMRMVTAGGTIDEGEEEKEESSFALQCRALLSSKAFAPADSGPSTELDLVEVASGATPLPGLDPSVPVLDPSLETVLKWLETRIPGEEEENKIYCEIICAEGIRAADKPAGSVFSRKKKMNHRGSSDPFVKVVLSGNARKSMSQKTKVLKKTLAPAWNETLHFDRANETERALEPLQMEVLIFDSDTIGKDFLGRLLVGSVEALPIGKHSPANTVKVQSLESRKTKSDKFTITGTLSYRAWMTPRRSDCDKVRSWQTKIAAAKASRDASETTTATAATEAATGLATEAKSTAKSGAGTTVTAVAADISTTRRVASEAATTVAAGAATLASTVRAESANSTLVTAPIIEQGNNNSNPEVAPLSSVSDIADSEFFKGMDMKLITQEKKWTGSSIEKKEDIHLWCNEAMTTLFWISHADRAKLGGDFDLMKPLWRNYTKMGGSIPLNDDTENVVVELDDMHPLRFTIRVNTTNSSAKGRILECSNEELAARWATRLISAVEQAATQAKEATPNGERFREAVGSIHLNAQIDNIKWPAATKEAMFLSVSVGTNRYSFTEYKSNKIVSCQFALPKNSQSTAAPQATLVICVWEGAYAEKSPRMGGKVEVILAPMLALLQSGSSETKTTNVKLEPLETNGTGGIGNASLRGRFDGAELTLTFNLSSEEAQKAVHPLTTTMSAFTTPAIHTEDHMSTVDHLLGAHLLTLRREISVAIGLPDFRLPITGPRQTEFAQSVVPLYLSGLRTADLLDNASDANFLQQSINPMQSRSDPSRNKSKIGYKQARVSMNKANEALVKLSLIPQMKTKAGEKQEERIDQVRASLATAKSDFGMAIAQARACIDVTYGAGDNSHGKKMTKQYQKLSAATWDDRNLKYRIEKAKIVHLLAQARLGLAFVYACQSRIGPCRTMLEVALQDLLSSSGLINEAGNTVDVYTGFFPDAHLAEICHLALHLQCALAQCTVLSPVPSMRLKTLINLARSTEQVLRLMGLDADSESVKTARAMQKLHEIPDGTKIRCQPIAGRWSDAFVWEAYGGQREDSSNSHPRSDGASFQQFAENIPPEQQEQVAAATSLQRLLRGKMARKQLNEERAAATSLQRMHRGKLARKKTEEIQMRHAFIKKIFSQFTPPSHRGHMDLTGLKQFLNEYPQQAGMSARMTSTLPPMRGLFSAYAPSHTQMTKVA